MNNYGKSLLPVIAGALCMIMGANASAQEHASSPVRMIVPFPPAGVVDIVGRIVSDPLRAKLDRSVVVDNRPGASGNIGMELAAKAPADGSVVVINTLPLVTSKEVYGNLKYDLHRDFGAVSTIATSPYVFVTNPSLPVKDLKSLLTLARAKPSQLTYGSAGAGSTFHLAFLLLEQMSNVRLQHVPYKGGGPALVDALAGHIDMTVPTTAAAAQYISSGRVRAIAVTTSSRVRSLPNVPTVAESGFPGYEFSSWVVMLVPAKTPESMVKSLHQAVSAVVSSAQTREKLDQNGFQPLMYGPAETSAFLKREEIRWTEVVRRAGIKAK